MLNKEINASKNRQLEFRKGYRPKKIINFLKSFKADIYCLQEVDRFVKRTGGKDILKLIENGLGLQSFYIKEFEEVESCREIYSYQLLALVAVNREMLFSPT